MTAITLATALAQKGYRVALADADPQKSSLQWLKLRPVTATSIQRLDWRPEKQNAQTPTDIEYLIIDAPGALKGERAEQLISESHALLIPLQPSFFDLDSTKRFLKHIQDIKRIRKGKIAIHLIANRVKSSGTASNERTQFFSKLEQSPVVWITERSAYSQLAMQGLSIFDKTQKLYLPMQQQWQALLDVLIDDPSNWF